MKQFFESIPASIEEAAHIDGAGTFRTFWSAVLPMARADRADHPVLPGLVENSFSDILIARESPSLDALTTGVGRLVSGELGTGTQNPLKLAAAVLLTVPVAVVFFAFQKPIVRTTEGALKE
jgi:multiple sugar transport system permease protein